MALSSCVGEDVGAGEATKQAILLRKLLVDFCLEQKEGTESLL